MFIVTIVLGEMLGGYFNAQEDTNGSETPATIVFTPDDDTLEWEKAHKE